MENNKSLLQVKHEIERIYNRKNIARCRYNALEHVFQFLKEIESEMGNVYNVLSSNGKEVIKTAFAKYKKEYLQNENPLSGAENQAINDLFNYLKSNLNINESNDATNIHESALDSNCSKVGLEPWCGEYPKVLILGTMPGDLSIEKQAYYSNIQHNSFWKIMHTIFSNDKEIDNKKFITSKHIALWDCVEYGKRQGSTDSGLDFLSLSPNHLDKFLQDNPTIKTIILNGKSKGNKKNPSTLFLFRHFFSHLMSKYEILILPSTSNTNAIAFEEKLKEWSIVKEKVE